MTCQGRRGWPTFPVPSPRAVGNGEADPGSGKRPKPPEVLDSRPDRLIFRAYPDFSPRPAPAARLPQRSKLLDAPAPSLAPGLARVKLFLALSRTPHGLLDLATPALAALLALGGLPPLTVTALGLVTVFAGYTAVYALNDVVDYRVDQEKLRHGPRTTAGGYLDAIFMRHPLAQGQVSYREGLLWTGAWALVAGVGAYLLNPVCALIFLLGGALEAVYCRLLKVSHLRALISGLVKTLGGLAAVLAVNPQPRAGFLLLLFAWLFCWEIGGQNIPADWHDLEQDRSLGARTIPVRYGEARTGGLALAALSLAVALGVVVLMASAARPGPFFLGLAALLGAGLLVAPAFGLWRTRAPEAAAVLFNRASYYPLAMLGLVLLSLIF
jgi:4-hydroxybenzoate polyprenyltransferase